MKIGLLSFAVLFSLWGCDVQPKVTILYCYDGDTCRALVAGLQVNLRLVGIDTPELKGRSRKADEPWALEAKTWLNQELEDAPVTLTQYGLGRYNRPLVELFKDGLPINLELVKRGYARVYRKSPKNFDIAPYLYAQREARQKSIGIWENH